MDSINKNQAEQNHENLEGTHAVARIKEMVEQSPTCFFCTSVAMGSMATRPMNVRKVDDEGNLWFLSAEDSHKNVEIAVDESVKLYFQGSSHSDFLYLTGTAITMKDRAKIKELWHPLIKTWFTGGQDDPRITVIKVTPIDGYYWDTKHGYAVAGIKMLMGAVIGTTMDDSIEGKLTV